MFDYMEDYTKKRLEDIKFAQQSYDLQELKVKQEEYVKNLIFEDLVYKVKQNISRYDTMNIFRDAQSQLKEKNKKERFALETLNRLLVEDFFNNNEHFKITNIVACGYEDYCWNVYFDYGVEFYIAIPIMKNIDERNFNYANKGMFQFVIKESESFWTLKKSSYNIKEIADYIKEYFKLDSDE